MLARAILAGATLAGAILGGMEGQTMGAPDLFSPDNFWLVPRRQRGRLWRRLWLRVVRPVR